MHMSMCFVGCLCWTLTSHPPSCRAPPPSEIVASLLLDTAGLKIPSKFKPHQE